MGLISSLLRVVQHRLHVMLVLCLMRNGETSEKAPILLVLREESQCLCCIGPQQLCFFLTRLLWQDLGNKSCMFYDVPWNQCFLKTLGSQFSSTRKHPHKFKFLDSGKYAFDVYFLDKNMRFMFLFRFIFLLFH